MTSNPFHIIFVRAILRTATNFIMNMLRMYLFFVLLPIFPTKPKGFHEIALHP
jgi:hypothetical protein